MKENLPSNIQKESKVQYKAQIFKPPTALTVQQNSKVEIPKISAIDAKHEKDPKYCSIYASSVIEKQFKLEKTLMKELDKDILSWFFKSKRTDYFSNVIGLFYETVKISDRYATYTKTQAPTIDFSNLFLELQILDWASRKIHINDSNVSFVVLGSCLIGEKC